MRITLLTSSYPRFNGDTAAPFIKSIAEALVAHQQEVAVVAPYDPQVKAEPTPLPVHRFRYAPLAQWHIMGHAAAMQGDNRLKAGAYALLPGFLLSEWGVGWQVARRQHADAIYAHWVIPNGVVGALLAKQLRRPLLLSLHGSDIYFALRQPAFGRVAGWVLRQATAITACSPDLRAGAIQLGAAPERTHLLPWGVDPVRFHPNIPPLPRAQFGIPETAFVIVSLGRFVPKKGFEVLLQALPTLLKTQPNTHVLIGGEGPQRTSLTKLAGQLGITDHIHLPGNVNWNAAPGFIALGDVFCLPSIRDAAGNQDGLPTVLLEAMSLAKPIVASEIAGMSLVLEHGRNGILLPAGDAQRLADALNNLATHPEHGQALGQRARAAVETRFNWDCVASQIIQFLQGNDKQNYA